jgi:O-antigen ligase
MNRVSPQKNGAAAHDLAPGESARIRIRSAEPRPALARVDALQKMLWGALIISFPFTAVSVWPARLKTFGEPAVLLALSLAALTLLGAMLPGGRIFVPRDRSAILMAVFLIVIGASFFVNYPINPYMWPGHNPWTKSAKQVTQWFTDGVILYLTLRFVRTWSDFRFALQCYFIGFLCTAGAAVINIAASHWPAGYAASLFGLLHNGAWSGQTRRLTLLAYEPSLAGDYLLSVVPLLVCGSFYWKSRWWTAVWSVVGIALFCGTFSLGCFGSLFGACIIVTVVYARRGSKGLLIGSCLLAAVLLTAVVTSSKGERFLGDRVSAILESGLDPSDIPDFSTRQRLACAEAAFNIFLEHPVLGVGIGKSPFYMYSAYPFWATNQGDINGATFYTEAGSSGYTPDSAISYNLFMQILAETGLLGITVFVALLLSMLADCYGSLNAAQEKWKRRAFAGILFALVAEIIHYNAMMTSSGMRYSFFIWGLAICAARLLKQKDLKIAPWRMTLRRNTAALERRPVNIPTA